MEWYREMWQETKQILLHEELRKGIATYCARVAFKGNIKSSLGEIKLN